MPNLEDEIMRAISESRAGRNDRFNNCLTDGEITEVMIIASMVIEARLDDFRKGIEKSITSATDPRLYRP